MNKKMGRKKVNDKNRIVSISVTPNQYDFIKTNKNFDLSKFVQLCLIDHMNLYYELIEMEGGN